MYDRKLRCAEVIDCQDALVSRNKRGKTTTQMSERSHCEVWGGKKY